MESDEGIALPEIASFVPWLSERKQVWDMIRKRNLLSQRKNTLSQQIGMKILSSAEISKMYAEQVYGEEVFDVILENMSERDEDVDSEISEVESEWTGPLPEWKRQLRLLGENISYVPRFIEEDNPSKGWTREVLVKATGVSAGSTSIVYRPPNTDKSIRSRNEVINYYHKYVSPHEPPSYYLDRFDFKQVFCTCHEPEVDGDVYMACSCNRGGCGGWVHTECVCLGFLSAAEISTISNYCCPLCQDFLKKNNIHASFPHPRLASDGSLVQEVPLVNDVGLNVFFNKPVGWREQKVVMISENLSYVPLSISPAISRQDRLYLPNLNDLRLHYSISSLVNEITSTVLANDEMMVNIHNKPVVCRVQGGWMTMKTKKMTATATSRPVIIPTAISDNKYKTRISQITARLDSTCLTHIVDFPIDMGGNVGCISTCMSSNLNNARLADIVRERRLCPVCLSSASCTCSSSSSSSSSLPCSYCNFSDGAKTDSGNHPYCFKIHKIASFDTSNSGICAICNSSIGVVISCPISNCHSKCHAICAQLSNNWYVTKASRKNGNYLLNG